MIDAGQRYQFYYEMKNNFVDTIGTRPNGEIHHVHGVIVNKLCNCKQGIELRVHSTPISADKPDTEK